MTLFCGPLLGMCGPLLGMCGPLLGMCGPLLVSFPVVLRCSACSVVSP